MGIRFLCPNGHRLNVKSHLAGKRGICPDCKVRFVIPAESGGTVEALEPATVAAEMPSVAEPAVESAPPTPTAPPATAAPQATAPPPSPVRANEPPLPQAAGTALPDLWYVNSGDQQFGPANTETFTGWIAAGRVPADSLVWRTGWEEWKNGGEVIAELNVPPAPAQETVVAIGPDISTAGVPVDSYRVRQRRRRDRAKVLTMSLAALVFVLLVVLVVVLVRN